MLVFGAVYVSGVSPEVTADGRMIMRAAEDFHNGDFSAITTTDSYYGRYFHNYQYQLGLALYFELLIKVFGAGHLTAMALTNVALYAAACAAIVLMAGELYSDKRIAVLTALLLAAFLQPVLYCGLLYGPVPGYAFSVFSALCFVLYLKRGRRFLILPMALFAAAGAALKINCMIYVIAMAILLMIDALGRKRLFSLLGAALLIGAAVLLPKAIVKTYEARAGAALSGSGTPALNWVICGLSESDRAPGWYFDQPYDYSPENIDESKAQIARDLAGRLMRFQSDPAYAAGFFYKKQLSLWDEPTYQSVWVTRIKKLEKTMPPLVERIYTSSVTGVLYGYFRYQVQGIYLLIVLGLLGVIGETKRRALSLPDALCRALIPTVLLGAFLYHFVAEAKSQYVLLYVAFALPCAAAGLLSASDFIEKRILFRAKRGA